MGIILIIRSQEMISSLFQNHFPQTNMAKTQENFPQNHQKQTKDTITATAQNQY